MSQCVILNVTDAHNWDESLGLGGLKYIPSDVRSTALQASREQAEVEAARLAMKTGGYFAVLEVVGVVRTTEKPSHVTVGGAIAATHKVPEWLQRLEV